MKIVLPALLVLGFPLLAAPFLEKPYLQLGADPRATASLSLLWHAPDRNQAWSVAIRAGDGAWRTLAPPTCTRVAVATVAPHRVYRAVLAPLEPGAPFTYRVRLGGRQVFQATGQALKKAGQAQRVAVLGDVAWTGPAPRAMAFQVQQARPDLVLLPGDIVYQDGRIQEYRRYFYPAFNADAAGPELGAPLMRSVAVVGALGNHDAGERGPSHPRAAEPDALAWFLYWDQPLNGPPGIAAPPRAPASGWSWDPFLAAAGPRFPTMATFSFRAGDAHVTVLDSNAYVDWEDPGLRAWLERDLDGDPDAIWRLVMFHHPPFNADRRFPEMWMAQLWPIFEKHGVDLVLAGHVHTYQRSRPIRFTPAPGALADLAPGTRIGELRGDLQLDTQFDGVKATRPRGIIEVISGAGGAPLHAKGRALRYDGIRPLLDTFNLDSHSFSLLEMDGRRLDFRQVDEQGRTLDRFTLTK